MMSSALDALHLLNVVLCREKSDNGTVSVYGPYDKSLTMRPLKINLNNAMKLTQVLWTNS